MRSLRYRREYQVFGMLGRRASQARKSQPDALARDSTGTHTPNARPRSTPFVPQGPAARGAVLGLLFVGMSFTSAEAQQELTRERDVVEREFVGYDRGRQAQRMLLDFVSPVYQAPVMTSHLLESLIVVDENASEKRKAAADDIATVGALTAKVELQGRLAEQSMKAQILRAQGIVTPGARSMDSMARNYAKAEELQARMAMLREELSFSTERTALARERKKEEVKARIESIKDLDVSPVIVSSGRPLNIVIDSFKRELLENRFDTLLDPDQKELIEGLTIQPEDLQHIRLKLDVNGHPVIFTAAQGSGSLHQVPVAMQHPDVLPIVKEIESKFTDLMAMSPQESLHSVLQELQEMLSQLEEASDKALGSAKDAAQKGEHAYAVWSMARDYRTQLKGIINRMELEGSTDVLRVSRGKFNPEIHGNDALAFTRFVVDNQCQIAPALPGGEGAYVRYHTLLLQLNAILEE